MLSVTVGMGATAADTHPVDAEEIACMTADAAAGHDAEPDDAEDNDSKQRPSHKHHTHSCGSCHLHMVSVTSLTFSYASSVTLALRPGADQHASRVGPYGLYRPPRA